MTSSRRSRWSSGLRKPQRMTDDHALLALFASKALLLPQYCTLLYAHTAIICDAFPPTVLIVSSQLPKDMIADTSYTISGARSFVGVLAVSIKKRINPHFTTARSYLTYASRYHDLLTFSFNLLSFNCVYSSV